MSLRYRRARLYRRSSSNPGSITNRRPTADNHTMWFKAGNTQSAGQGYNMYVGDTSSSNWDYASGARFANMTIPVGATITSATVTLRAYPALGAATDIHMKIRGQAADNPGVFTTAADFAARSRTTAGVDWDPTAWVNGTTYTSPSIVAIIQEIVSRPGWASGNALVIFFEDDSSVGWGGVANRSDAWGYDINSPGSAPGLSVGWT